MNQHKISLLTAVLINMNIMIGSGILIGPSKTAAIAGNASFLSWLLVALLFLPLVLSTVQLSRMCPGAGGFYAYAKQGLNIRAGYISALLYIIGYTFAAVVEILALKEMLSVSFGLNWLLEYSIIGNFLLALICTAINLVSFKVLSNFLNSLTISKLIPLVALIVLIPFALGSHFIITAPEISMLPSSLPLVIFGYIGFEYCCSISHLIKDSEKNAPRAILFGFLGTALIYTLFNFGVLNLMGISNLIEYGTQSFARFINLPIPYLKELLMWLIPVASILTVFAGAIGMINGNAILIHSIAQDKLFAFWPTFAQLSAAHRPWAAVILQGILVFLIATLVPNITIVGGLCNLGIFLSFILPFVSLLVLQKRVKTSYKLMLTLLALAIIVGLVAYSWYNLGSTIRERLLYSLILLIILTIGLIVHYVAPQNIRQ